MNIIRFYCLLLTNHFMSVL